MLNTYFNHSTNIKQFFCSHNMEEILQFVSLQRIMVLGILKGCLKAKTAIQREPIGV